MSTLPWVRYTAIRQPVPSPADSNPRLTWGKYVAEGERTVIPVTLLVNHALVDGAHIAAFTPSWTRSWRRSAPGRERRRY